MNTIRVKLTEAPEVKRVVLVAFPGYRKREAVIATMGPSGVNINSYWDGGSKAEFALVDIATMRTRPLPKHSHPFFDVQAKGIGEGENEDIAVDNVGNVTLKRLPNGVALVEAGTFCGKPATATVMVNAATLTPMLPQVTP